jgi:hypothetical protein
MDLYSFFVAYLGLLMLEAIIKFYDWMQATRRRMAERFLAERGKKRS